jgi:hypothetical protein
MIATMGAVKRIPNMAWKNFLAARSKRGSLSARSSLVFGG